MIKNKRKSGIDWEIAGREKKKMDKRRIISFIYRGDYMTERDKPN